MIPVCASVKVIRLLTTLYSAADTGTVPLNTTSVPSRGVSSSCTGPEVAEKFRVRCRRPDPSSPCSATRNLRRYREQSQPDQHLETPPAPPLGRSCVNPREHCPVPVGHRQRQHLIRHHRLVVDVISRNLVGDRR